MKQIRIVGVGRTPVGRLGLSAVELAKQALDAALKDAGFSPLSMQQEAQELHGLIAVPSLSDPSFMQAHQYASRLGLFPSRRLVVRTVDTGGAGPISAISEALPMIQNGWADTIAILASDAVLSLDSKEFERRASGAVSGGKQKDSSTAQKEGGDAQKEGEKKRRGPLIPLGYDRVAQWQMSKYGVTREQLAMVPVLMSHMAARHPDAACKQPFALEEVLASKQIGPVTNLLECARRCDGAACIILSSTPHYMSHVSHTGKGNSISRCPEVTSTGEASGPSYPPKPEKIDKDLFSCEKAANLAYRAARLTPQDIDFFGLYDCFPICFIRALEGVGLVKEGEGGAFVEKAYKQLMQTGELTDFPINTHGGLLAFGAPWEVPAMYNVIEAVEQLRGEADVRQLSPLPKRALVYGNGGVFSASSVAILSVDTDAQQQSRL
mmetsp:Transcript_42932/g.96486  ORF Transcript_42932/g.96486 Transcript_42932/m.96486 type:complete len:437 (+) Transcript_42932:19-1329(+)